MLINAALHQLNEALAPSFNDQARRFLRQLVLILIQKGDFDAAIAASEAKPIANPQSKLLELVFSEPSQLIKVRRHTDLLIVLAERETVSIFLKTDSGSGMTHISPNQAEIMRRNGMNSPVIAVPSLECIQVAEMALTPTLMRVMLDFFEHPEMRCGVVELGSQRQVMITASSAEMILGQDYRRLRDAGKDHIIKERVGAATRLRREDYFYDYSLEQFERMTRELTPNDPSSTREITIQGEARSGEPYQWTHRYRLIQDESGRLYHVGQNLGFEPIREPIAV